ncbi:hypothetical protein [Streptomyces sp. NPDC007088]|uniref:hypothetical protein n=1 Tax=Streptomyces sp. NPDC007088 TaxID=3364773 RepID=UPI0036CB5183
MLDPELLERITARRAELDEPEEQLATQLEEVRPNETNSPSPNAFLNGWPGSSPRNAPPPGRCQGRWAAGR